MKKLSIQNTILLFVFLFLFLGVFNKNFAQFNDPFFPNNVNVNGPGFFPFSSSQGSIESLSACSDPIFIFDGPPGLSGATLEAGPAANGFETSTRGILVFDMDGNATYRSSDFPLINPSTMSVFDPDMGDVLGLSLVPGNGFPSGSTTFMITTVFNCGDEVTTSSTSSSTTSSSGSVVASSSGSLASSSGVVLTDRQIISSAIKNEKEAKKLINVKTLLMGGTISVSMAIDELMSSVSDLNDLSTMISNGNAMLGMGTIQSAIDEVISSDNEAIMTLEPFANTEPSITNGDLTTALTKVNMILNDAIMIKERIESKIKKSEK